jgi:hypothetical protein
MKTPLFRNALAGLLIIVAVYTGRVSWLRYGTAQATAETAAVQRTAERASLAELISGLEAQLARRRAGEDKSGAPSEGRSPAASLPTAKLTQSLVETLQLLAPSFRNLNGAIVGTLYVSSGSVGLVQAFPPVFAEAFGLTPVERSALEAALADTKRQVGGLLAARAAVTQNVTQGDGTVVIETSPLPESAALQEALLAKYREILGPERFVSFEVISGDAIRKSFYRFGAEPTTFTVTYSAGLPVQLQIKQAKQTITTNISYDIIEAIDDLVTELPSDRLDPALRQPFLEDRTVLGKERAVQQRQVAELKGQLGDDFMKQKVTPALKAYAAAHDNREPPNFPALKDLKPYFDSPDDAVMFSEAVDRIQAQTP